MYIESLICLVRVKERILKSWRWSNATCYGHLEKMRRELIAERTKHSTVPDFQVFQLHEIRCVLDHLMSSTSVKVMKGSNWSRGVSTTHFLHLIQLHHINELSHWNLSPLKREIRNKSNWKITSVCRASFTVNVSIKHFFFSCGCICLYIFSVF